MWEAREARSIIDAAEKAAAAGNHSSAEKLLRDAARLQEARLGPLHPDLANTLNNLGVVCEITGKPADAEQCFRRAVAIATTALEADHPFVTTSRKNLLDFCRARGITVEVEQPAPPAASSDPELDSGKFFTRVAIGALGPIAMLMVVLAAGLPRLGKADIAPLPVPVSVDAVEPTVTPEPPATTDSSPEPEDVNVISSPTTPGQPTVVRASLCANIDDWICDPPDAPVPSGPLFFYTQVKSASATTIQHRWYRDNLLNHRVDLRVQASPAFGYRTYSRNTMNADSVGSWRVELRSEDGTVLHEERFTVR
jgi:hypothetical protein